MIIGYLFIQSGYQMAIININSYQNAFKQLPPAIAKAPLSGLLIGQRSMRYGKCAWLDDAVISRYLARFGSAAKMDFIQTITKENLPSEFKAVILCEKSKPQEGNFYLRCALFNMQECNDWVSAFSQNTSTQWKIRRTKPNSSVKIVFQYVLSYIFLCKI